MKKLQPELRFKEFSENWKEKLLENVFDRINNPVQVEEEELYQQIGIRSHGKGIFHKDFVTGKKLGNKRVFWIEKDVFIVNIVFAWERAIAQTTDKEIGMIASHRFPMYKPKKDHLNLDFITTFFKTKKGQYNLGLASPGGAGRNKTLGQKNFNELKLILPSIQEQEKIASFLSSVDEKIQRLESKKEKLEEYKKGIMQKIFSQKIRFKDDSGQSFPDWEEKKLGEIGTFKNGVNKSKNDFGFGKSFINLMDIFGKNKIFNNKYGLVNVTDKEMKDYSLKKGDVLFIRSSVKPSGVGTTAVVMENLNDTVYSGFIIRFREKKEILNLKFKKYCFYTSQFRNEIMIKSTTSANTNINQESLVSLKIPFPCFEEQERIADFLSSVDENIEKVGTEIDEMKEFKKGLLQGMFV